jgi:hypothetical protein
MMRLGMGDYWVYHIIPGWWYTYPSEKYKSVGVIVPNIYGTMFQTTNQIWMQPRGPTVSNGFHVDDVDPGSRTM